MDHIADARRLLREASWIVFAQAATLIARLVALKALTSLLDPVAYGEFILLLGLAALGLNVFCGPIQQAALRFHADAARVGELAGLRRLIETTLKRNLAVLLGGILIAGFIWARPRSSVVPALAVAALATLIVADFVRATEMSFLNAARRQGAFGLWTALDAWARPICGIVAVLLFGPSSSSALWGFAVGCAAVAVPFTLRVRGPARSGDDRSAQHWMVEHRAAFKQFLTPLIPLAILAWVIGLADRYFLAALSGKGVAGIYGAAYGLSSAPFLMLGSIGVMTFRPYLFDCVARRDKAGQRTTLLLWTGGVVGLGLLGLLALVAFGEALSRVLLGPAFRGGAVLLPWIGAAYLLQALQFISDTWLYAVRRTNLLLWVQVVGAAGAVGLYLWLIPYRGALGAAIATFGAFCLSALVSLLLAVRARPQ